MSTIFVHPSRKSFYHRTHVPKRLRQLMAGRAEVWRSLDTLDKAEAKARSAAWDSRIQRLFVTLKKDGDSMTDAEREALVTYWLESELDYAEDCRVLAGDISDAHRESQLEGLSIMEEQASEALMSNHYRKVKCEADKLLKAAGLPPIG